MSARRLTATVALVASAVLLTAGCSVSTAGSGVPAPTSSAPTATPSSSAPTSASGSAAPASGLGATLQAIALQAGDLSPGYTVRLIAGGDRVAGQVTLDDCGFRFSTEADRVARRQYDVLAPSGQPVGVSNEVVAYRTPAQADEALAQWYTSAATCPHKAVSSGVAGMRRARVSVLTNRRDARTLPATRNVTTIERESIPREPVLYLEAVYQVHGRVLDGIYLNQDVPISATAQAAARKLATITGRRLVHDS